MPKGKDLLKKNNKRLRHTNALFWSSHDLRNGKMLEFFKSPSSIFGLNPATNSSRAFCTVPEQHIVALPPKAPRGGEKSKTLHHQTFEGDLRNLLSIKNLRNRGGHRPLDIKICPRWSSKQQMKRDNEWGDDSHLQRLGGRKDKC